MLITQRRNNYHKGLMRRELTGFQKTLYFYFADVFSALDDRSTVN